MIGNYEQPKKIAVNGTTELVKYYPYYGRTLAWYQDAQVCRQVDNTDRVYDLDRLKRMYRYLSTRGECYYIKAKVGNRWRLVGDISLCDNEISIVVSREYQNRHIGRNAIKALLNRAKELDMREISATIYSFNQQSKRAFEAVGFHKAENEKYVIVLL